MKKLLVVAASLIMLCGCDPHMLESVVNSLPQNPVPLSNTEVINGLKEALRVGTETAVRFTAKDGGFNNNARIRIPFPEEAEKVKTTVFQLGMAAEIKRFEDNLNRAAEKAAAEAIPVFVDAITSMSIEDGFAILKGDSLAATSYLKQKTTAQLTNTFRPIVDRVIDEIKLTSYWEPLTKAYNTTTLFTGQSQVNPDLGQYVTQKALAGLFIYVGEEEARIRRDPKARVSDILVRVFGSLDR
jgi:hypothetical protein